MFLDRRFQWLGGQEWLTTVKLCSDHKNNKNNKTSGKVTAQVLKAHTDLPTFV
jgi:hypothetical protein